MKTRAFWLVVPLALVAFQGCEKKQAPASEPAAAAEVSTPAPETPPAAPADTPADAPARPAPAPGSATQTVTATDATPATPEQRAELLGFVRYLPADTESVIAVHNGGKIAERAQEFKLFKLLQENIGSMFGAGMMGQPRDFDMEGEGMDGLDFAIPEEDSEEMENGEALDDEGAAVPRRTHRADVMLVTADGPDPDSDEAAEGDADEESGADPVVGGDDEMDFDEMPQMASITEILDQEITFAVGKTAGAQLTNLTTAYARFYHFLMRTMTRKFGDQLKAGEFSSVEPFEDEEDLKQLFNDLLADPESGFGLLERAAMPPVYLAFRGDPEKCDAVAKSFLMQLDGMAEAGPFEPVTIERGGAKLSGHKLAGEALVEEMDEYSRESMEEMLGTENTTKLLELMAKKNLVIAAGTVGEYMVLFFGSSEEDFALTDQPAESLAGGKALAFADAYASQELVALIYGSEAASQGLYSAPSGLTMYANAIREGLAAWDGPIETRDLETLLQNLAEHETAIRKMGTAEALGVVAFFDQGLRVESFGGYDSGGIDWETPCQLAHLGDAPDVVFFANMTSKAAYDEASLAYLESMAAVAYAAASKAAELEIESEELGQMKEFVGVFNEKLRPHVAAIWDALNTDLNAGLGQETALVVDLNGSMPKIPAVPETVIEKAKVPRATLIKPVTDRTKLRESWTKIHASSTKLMAAISEMAGEEIPMQEAIDSEKDGFTTWFFSLPFQTRDFIPSVTVSDKWFAASTSRQRALELLASTGQPATPRTGVWARVNFEPIRGMAEETMKMLEDNAAEIFGEDSPALDSLEQSKELRGKLVEALADLDSLTVHARRENGTMRSSVHFKTR